MVSSSDIVKAIQQSIKESKGSENLSDSLLEYLKKNHLLSLLPNIVKKLETEKMIEEKKNSITIHTSHEFNEKMMSKIKGFIETGKENIFTTVVDPLLIGGFVIKGKNKIVDASLRKNLHSLKESLIQ